MDLRYSTSFLFTLFWEKFGIVIVLMLLFRLYIIVSTSFFLDAQYLQIVISVQKLASIKQEIVSSKKEKTLERRGRAFIRQR